MPEPQFDLLIQDGHVIDPASGIDGTMDVGIAGGKIAQVAEHIAPEQTARVIDARGLYVAPGIIDMHAHVYKFRPTEHSYIESINADAHCLHSGVTTVVDTGSAGTEHFPDFVEHTIRASCTRILAFLNIARGGMVDARSEQDPAAMDVQAAVSTAKQYPDLIVGIKTAHYWTNQPWDAAHPAWASVERAVEAGELCGLPVMADFWPRPPERPYPDLIATKLRPGDIHTHVFAQQFPVLDDAGKVNAILFAARERGVIFDLGHGAASFWFRNAVPALRGGFAPDTISTDLHMGNINGPVISMAHTMSKFLNMGMPLAEVIRRATLHPARVLRRPALGTLTPGAEADVAVFDLREGAFAYADCGGARLDGKYRLECRLTLRAGQIVYDPGGLSLPDWEHAPAAYWQTPELQKWTGGHGHS